MELKSEFNRFKDGTADKLNLIARTAANKRIANLLVSVQLFIEKVDAVLEDTKTDEFMDNGDPIGAIEDIERLFNSFKGYFRKGE